ncbi:hypothetical protein ACFV30_43140 [Streptomyces sp. NPDC059752]|uniref:hypothetical protein n=1 Tax=unclassified Streptomyces TaxID=2593676 RepID=UPI0036623142
MSVRRKRIVVCLAISTTAAVLAFGGWYAYQLSAALVGTLGVPCDKAAHFAHAAELPAGTRDRNCTTAQWMNASYELDFRAPRQEVAAWLRASYPDTEISDCSSADACGQPQLSGPTPFKDEDGHRLADGVHIELDYEGGDVTHVRISGFTV